jgi:hypothetical protein
MINIVLPTIFNTLAVIRQDASLRCDQVLLPYACLVKCMQQQIINILVRNYNISPNDAYNIWRKALAKEGGDPRIKEILNTLIKSKPEGIPVLINRNQYQLG